MTPIPPSLANAIANSASVTVSIAEEITGMLRLMAPANTDPMLASEGKIELFLGTRRTSSKLKPNLKSSAMRNNVCIAPTSK